MDMYSSKCLNSCHDSVALLHTCTYSTSWTCVLELPVCMCVAVCLLYAVVASLCIGLQGIASASAQVRVVQHFVNGCHKQAHL